jgi:hypothetical protein
MQENCVLFRRLSGSMDLTGLETALNKFVREIEEDALILVGLSVVAFPWLVAIATVRRGTIPPLTEKGPRPYYTMLPSVALAGEAPGADTDRAQGD